MKLDPAVVAAADSPEAAMPKNRTSDMKVLLTSRINPESEEPTIARVLFHDRAGCTPPQSKNSHNMRSYQFYRPYDNGNDLLEFADDILDQDFGIEAQSPAFSSPDAYDEALGTRPRSKMYKSVVDPSGKVSPVSVFHSCTSFPDFHIAPKFDELFRLFEKGNSNKSQKQTKGTEVDEKNSASWHSMPTAKTRISSRTFNNARPITAPPAIREERQEGDDDTCANSLSSGEAQQQERNRDASSTTSTQITSNTTSLPQIQVLTREIETLKTMMHQNSLKTCLLKEDLDATREELEKAQLQWIAAQDTLQLERDLHGQQRARDSETISNLQREREMFGDHSTRDGETIAGLKRECELYVEKSARDRETIAILQSRVETQVEQRCREEREFLAVGQIALDCQKEIEILRAQVQQLTEEKTALEVEIDLLLYRRRRRESLGSPGLNDSNLRKIYSPKITPDPWQDNIPDGVEARYYSPQYAIADDTTTIDSSSKQQESLFDLIHSLEARWRATEQKHEQVRLAQEEEKQVWEEALHAIKQMLQQPSLLGLKSHYPVINVHTPSTMASDEDDNRHRLEEEQQEHGEWKEGVEVVIALEDEEAEDFHDARSFHNPPVDVVAKSSWESWCGCWPSVAQHHRTGESYNNFNDSCTEEINPYDPPPTPAASSVSTSSLKIMI